MSFNWILQWLCRLEADRLPLTQENTARYRAELPFQWPCSVEVSTHLFQGCNFGALPNRAAIYEPDGELNPVCSMLQRQPYIVGGSIAPRPRWVKVPSHTMSSQLRDMLLEGAYPK